MSITLATPKIINDTITKIKITSLTIDSDRQELHVSYDGLDSTDGEIVPAYMTIEQPLYGQYLAQVGGANLIAKLYLAMAAQDPELTEA